ncbi:hypothetical protein L6164_030685 [Bauhinia variegata]|uniref:Uncharacterized protein n=1 Tax=Bauhinia variegata TaxID=167791 RepID=A0ACB9LDG2_BAUVA|nr:hypothetical protein L6164_030685 [Bauhinia variegata]
MNSQMIPSPHQVLPVPYKNPGPAHYNFLSHPSTGGSFRSPRFEPSARPLMNSIQGPSHSPYPSSGYRNSPSPGSGRGYCNNRSPG